MMTTITTEMHIIDLVSRHGGEIILGQSPGYHGDMYIYRLLGVVMVAVEVEGAMCPPDGYARRYRLRNVRDAFGVRTEVRDA